MKLTKRDARIGTTVKIASPIEWGAANAAPHQERRAPASSVAFVSAACAAFAVSFLPGASATPFTTRLLPSSSPGGTGDGTTVLLTG
ncbi:hypothetical protein [Streptomyces sp. NPDC127033]|uniref:hypothetical protein n=1 Tax=Streptomyces sp. NPDC127033 TaxID=3347110 RepID=UPI0036621ECE